MHAECDPQQADLGRRRASRVLLCACAALAACGSTSAGENPPRPVEQSAPQTPTGTPSETPAAAEVALAPQGFMELASNIDAPSIAAPEASARLACGRVGALPLSDEVPLLGGRLMIRGVQGAAIEPRPWNIMGAPEPVESETRLFLDTGREKVVVMAYELFALAGTDFIEQVRQDAPRAFPGTRLEHIGAIGEGLEGIQVVPATLDTSSEAVFTFGLYLISPNRTIQVVAFYVSPPAATDREACVGLAMRSARTLRVGEAALNFGAQEWRLTTGAPNEFVELTLPDRHVVITQEGPDFFVHRVSQLAVFGQPSAGGMLYFGGHPSRDEHAGARELEAPLLGTNTTWAYWTDDRAHAEALRPLNDYLFAHAMANGPDEASLSTLVQAFGRATLATP